MSKAREALELVNNGMTVTEAAKQVGVSTGAIYSVRSQIKLENKTTTKTYKKRKKPAVIALNTTAIPQNIPSVFVFYGNETAVANLVRSLQ